MKRERTVALILLYNEKKQILLQHRAEDEDILPGYWAFFCGRIAQKLYCAISLTLMYFDEGIG